MEYLIFRMRFLLLIFFLPLIISAQPADTVINGRRYHYFASYIRPDSLSVIEYCEHVIRPYEANGEFRAFAKSGVLLEQGRFRNGKKDGNWFSYYPDGKLECRGNYKKGSAIGKWMWYYPNGAVKGRANYIQKSVFVKVKIPSRQQTQFFTPKRYYPWFKVLIDTRPQDSLLEYYPDGQLKVRMRFDHNGNMIDSAEYYYPSGKLNCVQYYTDNCGTGCWKYYCSDGSLSHCENNSPGDPTHPAVCYDVYNECDYYEVKLEIPLKIGGIRAKF
jgi:hypothetical protein